MFDRLKKIAHDYRAEGSSGMVKTLIMIMLLVVIGLTLFSVVDQQATDAAANTTGASQSMILLVPMLFVLVIVVGIFVALLKQFDVI